MPLKSSVYVSGVVHVYLHSYFIMSRTESIDPLQGSHPEKAWRKISGLSLWLPIRPWRAAYLVNDTNAISYLKIISLLDPLHGYKIHQIENVTFDFTFMISVSANYPERKQTSFSSLNQFTIFTCDNRSLFWKIGVCFLRQLISNKKFTGTNPNYFKMVDSKFLGKNSKSLLEKGCPRN